MRKVLVTGGAGFIGSHLVDSLLDSGDTVVALDNLDSFYDPVVKRRNIAAHLTNPMFTLIQGDLLDEGSLDQVFALGTFDVVVHLAAMAGVRPSLLRPSHYIDVNVRGTQKLIDRITACSNKTKLVLGSSSSVYGIRSGESFCETDRIDQPLSPYAASKAAAELLGYCAHHTSGLKVVCLRFFTVYGPRQRPDLAIHKFCQKIDNGEPIEMFGDGSSKRDYTYVNDIIYGIRQSMEYDLPGCDVINLGRSDPITLREMIESLEMNLSKKATVVEKPMPSGEMPYTYANIEKARTVLSYNPQVSFEEGIKLFTAWYKHNKKALKP